LRRQAPVVEAALYIPDLADHSIEALALVGTPASQRALVEFASRDGLPIAERQKAAAALKKSVGERGILLTEDEIVRQYDRYNASEASDADTQKVLGDLLDTLESLRAKQATQATTGF